VGGVCLKRQLPVFFLALLVVASESHAAASEVSDADCERAKIEDVCDNIAGQMSEEVTLSTRKGTSNKEAGTRLNLACTTRKRMSLNLYNTSTGNIPLNNSGYAGNRGLVISAFGLGHKDRRTVTQTSGMFVILNKCELLKSHPNFRGMLFGDSQITPQLISGPTYPKDILAAESGAVERPVLPEEESSAGEDDLPMLEHDPTPWQLSGLYKTKIPNFQCLGDRGFLDRTRVRPPPGAHRGNPDWETTCPPKETLMMVDVVAAAWVHDKPKSARVVKSMPIINFDSGNGIVYHFIDGPPWKITDSRFSVSTTPGNSLNVNFPVLTITITIAHEDKDEDEHEAKRTMYAEVNFPRFGTFKRYEACKIRDLYDELDIKPRAFDISRGASRRTGVDPNP
jgi:hypothetical protein